MELIKVATVSQYFCKACKKGDPEAKAVTVDQSPMAALASTSDITGLPRDNFEVHEISKEEFERFWHQGIGGELLEEAERRIKDGHFNALTLWVLEKNALARRFYEARGFRLDTSRKEETIGGLLLTELRYEKRMHDRNRSDAVSSAS